MSSLSNSVVISRSPAIDLSAGSSLKSTDQFMRPTNLAFSFKGNKRPFTHKRVHTVQASYSDGGRPDNASIFVSGFVLGGLIVGALGCVYAPPISKALTETDKKDLMKKLLKFIYDEEKALEVWIFLIQTVVYIILHAIDILRSNELSVRLIYTLAIDNASTQLRSEEQPPNGATVSSYGIEALIYDCQHVQPFPSSKAYGHSTNPSLLDVLRMLGLRDDMLVLFCWDLVFLLMVQEQETTSKLEPTR
ncbi:hypothetical protein AAHA92_31259 [Salvia divinorum]|uniref:Uncharacterized protein n=1 Tax=Salvia divinorum TaxID=28513 RepID=A0ABD1FTK0_SALDI